MRCSLLSHEDQPESVEPEVVPLIPTSTATRARSGPEFCELTATGAPASKGFRAWVIKFIVHLHLLVLPATIDAVRKAGQDPLNLGAEWLVSNEQGRIVFDALVSCIMICCSRSPLTSSLVLLVLLQLPSSLGWCLLSQTRVLRCYRLGSTSLRRSRKSGCSVLVWFNGVDDPCLHGW